ncbi:MAG: LON peptidase substrate-binding domain-containing protein [Candidatus Acidiferrales bacterium]
MSTDLLPLFPLEVVLFPGMPLPLHIFEPRYKLLIAHCREQQLEFGVVLSRKRGPAEVGCSAEILKVIKEYPDGRLDILTVGQNRFRLLQVFEDLPYLQGRVDFLFEDENAEEAPAPVRLSELFEEAFLLTGNAAAPPQPQGGMPWSFHIAMLLPLTLDTKQLLLELESEGERQRRLETYLEEWLPQARRAAHLKEKASGNGHG